MMRDRTKTFNFLFFCSATMFILRFPNLVSATWSITAADPEAGEVGIERELEVMNGLGAKQFTIFQNNNCSNNYIGHVSNETGKIQLISSTQKNWYVISPDYDDTQRFLPDNLPDIFKKDGLKVIFSGKICEIPENVRLIGTPLILIGIEEVKTNNPDN